MIRVYRYALAEEPVKSQAFLDSLSTELRRSNLHVGMAVTSRTDSGVFLAQQHELTIAAEESIAAAIGQYLEAWTRQHQDRPPPLQGPIRPLRLYPDAYRGRAIGKEDGFKTVDEINDDMNAWQQAYRGVTRENQATTFQGRTIWALRIHRGAPARRLLITGAHHAREWIAAEIPYLIAERLATNDAHPDVRKILDKFECWIVPVVNPDGKYFSHQDAEGAGNRLWRKNRRKLRKDPAGRWMFGVDPNRNYYDVEWGEGGDSSGVPADESYRGDAAFSEPESTAVHKVVTQNNIFAALNFHAYGQTVLWPSALGINPPERLARLTCLAHQVAWMMNWDPWNGDAYVAGSTDDPMPISGDATNWMFSEKEVRALTIELPPRVYADDAERFRLPYSEVSHIFEGCWRGLCAFVEGVEAIA
jgi:carboxypeptidase T